MKDDAERGSDDEICRRLASSARDERFRGLELLFVEYKAFAERFALYHGAGAAAQDVVQSVILKLADDLEKGPIIIPKTLKAVICRRVRFACIDRYRKASREPEFEDLENVPGATCAEETINFEAVISLFSEFAALLNGRKQQIALYWEQNFDSEKTHREMSDEFNKCFSESISEEAFRNELSRVRRMFRRYLHDKGIEL